MKRFRFDVIVIGCGPAGATAAVTLARAGLSVLVLEAGVYAGAENWSGCVYFSENLAEPDAFGEAAVQAAPFERRLVRRGIFLHNGQDVVGLSYQDREIYRHCYTVLRPVYDPYWAARVEAQGAIVLPQTTVMSLIRRGNRVIGVETEHGPVYAEVTFIAEGDASHLIRRERLERVAAPRFMQGVKAVLSLPPAVIEDRFHLRPGEGCAHEYLIRNGQSGGQTVHLNLGAFLYTNRNSLSFGYVVPLDNLKDARRTDHGRLLEWLRGLPHFRSLLEGSVLSAYGAKLIRSGGSREQPVLIEDGLAVGGAATGLGIDLPYPNFTGPASASGLIFARAVRRLLADGLSITADRLKQQYLEPLTSGVYGRNAAFLSAWPEYLESSRTLSGRSIDLVCGTAHFITQPRASLRQTARFLRAHMTVRAIREFVKDTARLLRASGLRSALTSGLTFSIIGRWFTNLFRRRPQAADSGFTLSISKIDATTVDLRRFPRPIRSLLLRWLPGLAEGMRIVYANDGKPLQEKFRSAVRAVLGRLRITDGFVLFYFGLSMAVLAAASLLIDLFRYYLLRQPVEKLLRGPVSDYLQAQQAARDLDRVKTVDSFETKLAANSYRLGGQSHIRVLWPEELSRHGDLAQSPLWSVCPARVYQYDPPLVGRGTVTINYENCIKCESCWHAAPDQIRWGRHTDQRLIYRPESEAIQTLLDQKSNAAAPHPPREKLVTMPRGNSSDSLNESALAILNELFNAVAAVRKALRALEVAVDFLPASADATRREWPRRVGATALERIRTLDYHLSADKTKEILLILGIPADIQTEWRSILQEDQKDLDHHLSSGHEFHARSAARRIRNEVLSDLWDALKPALMNQTADLSPDEIDPGRKNASLSGRENRYKTPLHDRLSSLFPDREVKTWEDGPIPQEARERLLSLFLEGAEPSISFIRALSFVSPALGLLAARHIEAIRRLKEAGQPLRADLCAAEGDALTVTVSGDGIIVQGSLELVPLALAGSLLLIRQNRAWIVPLDQSGIKHIPTPGIGFRSAGLHRLEFDGVTAAGPGFPIGNSPRSGRDYAAVALGAADYLARRAMEHAEGRIQFSQQMRDTQGRDGIAKLGAVKAMIARTEAWHLLLSVLLREPEAPESDRAWEASDLCAAVSAMAFGPECGQIGYDAGQVFGGMAYSEDDLLSRGYRDSALFRYLAPGLGAAGRLMSRLQKSSPADWSSDDRDFKTVENGPMANIARRWKEVAKQWKESSSSCDPEPGGQAAALLLGARCVLRAVQERFESGLPVEGDAAACEVLLDMTEAAVDAVEFSRPVSPPLPVAVFPERPDRNRVNLPMPYEEISNGSSRFHPRPYRSGQYLIEAFDPAARFVPEFQLHDAPLRKRWEDCSEWFIKNFWTKRFEGLHIERHVEKIHGIPKGVLYGFKENGYFSTVIPSDLDGGGWWKAEYYILTTAAGRFGDAGLLLVIMASTSIGTTPALLGLYKELPLVSKELEPLARNPQQLGEIGERLDRLIASLKRPDPARLKKAFSELMGLVESRIRHTRVVKYLAANFLKAFYTAGVAGQRRELEGFSNGLKEAKTLFDHLDSTVREALAELPRRERAHQFFLRRLGHGGISAFALTEPTAGSDTGDVKTTARPVSRPLTPIGDGRYRFHPDGDKKPDDSSARYVIDADRVRFDARSRPSEMVYELPAGETVPIRHDEYHYDKDEGLRYYVVEDRKRYFHDIAQIRTRDDRPVYDYFELNGAKMWITNGRVATQYCLYAQSPEGVTGFMVDRHSEGLKVGADERKMGQRGSPTNEIAIDQVRVPKECIIGYEGHGQVNALETLNVGRCGLAVASITLMRKLIIEAVEQLPASSKRDDRLGEAAAILFGADSVAFYLIGLFDRHTTESVRMESAIAKYLCSEDLHEVIGLVEQAYGPAGVTEEYRVEKIRRDSRILNIYEGTNEVQRFLILKDLVAMTKDWKPLPVPNGGGRTSNLPPRLAHWKETLRSHVRAASDRLGDTIWMDAVLQPAYFPLADMAGEIFRLDCLAYRTRWLKENRGLLGADYVDPLLKLGEHAVRRTEHRLSALDRRYRRCADRSVKGLYAPEAVAADAALERINRKLPPDPRPTAGLSRPFRILCLLRLTASAAPNPRIREGRLSEIVWRINPSDEAAIGTAVRLKENSPSPVTVHLAMPGGPDAEPHLQWALAAGADAAYRIEAPVTAGGTVFVDAVAELEKQGRYDLILTGASSDDGAEPLGPFVAGALSRPPTRALSLDAVNEGRNLSVGTDPEPSTDKTLPMEPAVLAWEPTGPPLSIDINRWIQSRLTAIGRLPATGQTGAFQSAAAERFVSIRPTVQKQEAIRDLGGAADYLKTRLAEAQAMRAEPYRSVIEAKPLPAEPAVWTVLEAQRPKTIPALLGAARFLGQALDQKSYAVILAPESRWATLAGLARARGLTGAVCVSTPESALTESGRIEWLKRFTESAGEIRLLCGPEWAGALAYLSGRLIRKPALIFTDLIEIDRREGLSFLKPAYGAKLRRSLIFAPSQFPIALMTIASSGDFPQGEPSPDFRAVRAANGVAAVIPDWFDPTMVETRDDLPSAEAIIDIGYGVKNQDGFRLAMRLKETLEGLGLTVQVGATRKVTQDLKLLPLSRQIGQTGVRVNPKLILALGISGAPQHMDYIGDRAVILAFNKDPEAPLMKFNETRPAPIVHPIVGDLFVTIPKLIAMLSEQ